MAVGATAVWEVRPTNGDNTNGGGFDAGIVGAGTDYSQQAAAQLSLTDLATSGAGVSVVTSVTGGFTAQMVGNVLRINSGTNFTVGFYFITVFTNGNTVTVDRSPTPAGAGSGGNGKLGGATKSLSSQATSTLVSGTVVAGNKIWVKNEAGWNEPVNTSTVAGTANAPIVVEGYNAARGDEPTGNNRPENDRATAAGVAITVGAARWIWKHLRVARAGTHGFSYTNNIGTLVNCRARNCGSNGFNITGTNPGAMVIGCEADSNSIGFVHSGTNLHYGCVAHNNTSHGFSAGIRFAFCISYENGGDGWNVAGNNYQFVSCVADGNTGDGIETANPDGGSAIWSCILSNNGGYGLNVATGNGNLIPDYNNYFTNALGARNNAAAGANDRALDPQFVDRANGNFAIGENLKALGWPGVFPLTDVAGSTGYLDIGAVQRQEGAAPPAGPGEAVDAASGSRYNRGFN